MERFTGEVLITKRSYYTHPDTYLSIVRWLKFKERWLCGCGPNGGRHQLQKQVERLSAFRCLKLILLLLARAAVCEPWTMIMEDESYEMKKLMIISTAERLHKKGHRSALKESIRCAPFFLPKFGLWYYYCRWWPMALMKLDQSENKWLIGHFFFFKNIPLFLICQGKHIPHRWDEGRKRRNPDSWWLFLLASPTSSITAANWGFTFWIFFFFGRKISWR